jgi:hypothetical protein
VVHLFFIRGQGLHLIGALCGAPILSKLIKQHSASTAGHSVDYLWKFLMLKIEHSSTSINKGGIKITGWLFAYQALGGCRRGTVSQVRDLKDLDSKRRGPL